MNVWLRLHRNALPQIEKCQFLIHDPSAQEGGHLRLQDSPSVSLGWSSCSRGTARQTWCTNLPSQRGCGTGACPLPSPPWWSLKSTQHNNTWASTNSFITTAVSTPPSGNNPATHTNTHTTQNGCKRHHFQRASHLAQWLFQQGTSPQSVWHLDVSV